MKPQKMIIGYAVPEGDRAMVTRFPIELVKIQKRWFIYFSLLSDVVKLRPDIQAREIENVYDEFFAWSIPTNVVNLIENWEWIKSTGPALGCRIFTKSEFEKKNPWTEDWPEAEDILDESMESHSALEIMPQEAALILGALKSPKKAASSKENGRKGGRPKTSPLTRQEQQREYQRKRRVAAKAKSE